MLQMLHNYIAVFLKNRKCYEKVKITAQPVGPESFPQTEDIGPFEFALVPDKQHAKEEEKVGGVGGLEVQVEGWIHELDEMIKSKQLSTHAGLVAKEIAFLVRRQGWREVQDFINLPCAA